MADRLAIEELEGIALAAVMARKGVDAAAIGARLGITAPTGPTAAGDGALMLLGTGPGAWLARSEAAGADWADGLEQRLTGYASVSEVTDGYRLFRLAGPGARVLVQRGAPVDLHPLAFPTGSVAVTAIAHIGVIIRQVDDAPTYELAVFRSLGESFRHWLDVTAATVLKEQALS